MNIAQEQAGKLRDEATTLLRRMFDIRAGESNGTVERIVDCIIGAAMLETVIVVKQGLKGGTE